MRFAILLTGIIVAEMISGNEFKDYLIQSNGEKIMGVLIICFVVADLIDFIRNKP